MRLEGKVALISGGARGMGAAEARLFAREGAKVTIGDVLEEEGRRVEAEINETDGEALFVKLDVTRESDWQEAISATVARFGRLDILVNNAGIVASGVLEDTTSSQWDEIMEVNVKGAFLGSKASIPEMRKVGGGSIINISSISGNIGQDDVQPVYNASKGAVRILTKSTAVQYGKEGIRVNSVHPGMVDTPMIAGMMDDPEVAAYELAQIPLGRIAAPEEIAYGALFLASDESSYVTGSELMIDGGYTAR